MSEFEAIKRDFDNVKASVTVVSPFLSSLLRRVRVILTEGVETAGVTAKGIMGINPGFYQQLDYVDKAWLVMHEVLHIAFRDIEREIRFKKEKVFADLADDAVNNHLLTSFLRGTKLEEFGVTIQSLYYAIRNFIPQVKLEDMEVMNKEELYRLLKSLAPPTGGAGAGEPKCPKCGSQNIRCTELVINENRAEMRCDDCGHQWEWKIEVQPGAGGGGGGRPIPVDKITGLPPVNPKLRDNLEGKVLQEGDPEIYEAEGEEADERWKDAVGQAYSAQKTIGKIPAALKRMVDELFKSEVDWKTLLSQALHNGYGRTVVSSWHRPSRKHPSYPGMKRFTIPEIHVLVDCSGSIDKDELSQFLGEIYALARESPVHVLPWDAQSYIEVTARQPSEVIAKVAKMLRGGGGTVIASALIKTLERMRPKDMCVVLTDGDIWDVGEEETRRLLSMVATKSSAAIFGTTHTEQEITGWVTIKVKVVKA